MAERIGLFPQRIMKATPSKALVIRINLIFLAFFVVIYASLLLRPSLSIYHENRSSILRCSFRECHHKEEIKGVKMKAVLEESQNNMKMNRTENNINLEIPSFMKKLIAPGKGKNKKIGMVNMDEEIVNEWNKNQNDLGKAIAFQFERVTDFFKWEDLFPEWIDEEEESEVPTCPEIPMPDFKAYDDVDIVVAKLPCNEKERRDVFRLQVHLIVANMLVKKGKRDWNMNRRKTKVVFWSKCRPMMELFRCNDLVKREKDWWLYQPKIEKLEHKLALPVGSCQLALPLWGQGIHDVYDVTKIPTTKPTQTPNPKREAYATVLHSTEAYVCGAITLAQSLIASGTNRDLILLHDNSISPNKLWALSTAGWKLRLINRIRNPKAEKGSYNEYNYSKFRLWQLTQYDKVVFVDSDIVVLRNMDLLFRFPEITAAGNDFSLFNSGVMVIEPCDCTFRVFMEARNDVVSYNGGDQGFLNEMLVWWHRVPRRVNFLKNFWENSTKNEIAFKNELFGADPPKVYAVHYLGWKPWLCYRDYDCNWDKEESYVYASDVAHKRWWKIHDAMDEKLQKHCRLTKRRTIELEWDRGLAMKKALENGHWRINITDPRQFRLLD